MNTLSHPENPILDGSVHSADRMISDPHPAPISVTNTDTEESSTPDKTIDIPNTLNPSRDASGITSDPRPQASLALPNIPNPNFPDLPVPPIIISPFKPDLSGKYFNVTQEPLKFGDSFDFDFEIKNTGFVNAGGFWADFYLSTDSTISNASGSSDVLLGYQWISGLAAGATTGVLSKNLTLPDSINPFWDTLGNGTYYVGMISDALKTVSETNENNNSSTGWLVDYDDVYMSSPPGVDLSGQSFNVVQEPLKAGDNFDVTFEIKNTGGDNATGFWADFYLSADSDISNAFGSGDVLLGYQWIPSLAGGSTTGSLTKNLNLPNSSHPIWDTIGDGTYYIGVISDALGNVTETNETNNDSTAEFVDYDGVIVDTLASGVDLSGDYFNVIQEPLKAGDNFDVEFEIKNTGSDSATGFWADFYLSADSDISNAFGSGDVLLGYQWISSLAGDSTTGTLNQNLYLPNASHPIWDTIGDGTYYIGVISDALGNVTETNETNNDSTGWFVDYDDVWVTASFLKADHDLTSTIPSNLNHLELGGFNSDRVSLI